MTNELSPLDEQIGGDHYKRLGIQPFEITLANFGYQGLRAAVYNKVNKYLSRNKGGFNKHIEDIQKSIHTLQIQLEAAKHEQTKQAMEQTEERSYMYYCAGGPPLLSPPFEEVGNRGGSGILPLEEERCSV